MTRAKRNKPAPLHELLGWTAAGGDADAGGQVKQAPAGTDADYFILAFAKELRATIVSNDTFRDRGRQFADVRRRVIRYMIVAGEVVLERRTSKRE